MMTVRARMARCRARKHDVVSNGDEWRYQVIINGCDPACLGRESHNATHGGGGPVWQVGTAAAGWGLCFSSLGDGLVETAAEGRSVSRYPGVVEQPNRLAFLSARAGTSESGSSEANSEGHIIL
jgi:hypothetical protein